MSNFRIMLMSTVALGLTGAVVSSASAGEVEKSSSFSGHVNRVIGVVDDGDVSTFVNQDNGNSGSRFRFNGSAKSEAMTIGANIELSAGGNSASNAGTQTSGSVGLRHSNITFANSAGTLTMGHAWRAAATNPGGNSKSGAAGVGTGGATGTPIGAGFILENAGNTGGAEEALTRFAPWASMSTGRAAVVGYASPDLNGFSFNATLNAGDGGGAESADMRASYDADFDGTAVNLTGAYANQSGASTTDGDVWDVSLAAELASGVNAAIGYGEIEKVAATSDDTNLFLVELGYDMTGVSDLGGTSVNVTYKTSENVLDNTGEAKAYGINVAQSLSDYGTTVYGGLSHQTYDESDSNYEDVDAAWFGMKVTF